MSPPEAVFASSQVPNYVSPERMTAKPTVVPESHTVSPPLPDKTDYSAQERENDSHTCESCHVRPAAVYCISCAGRLCESCDRQIHANSFLARHARVPFADYRPPVLCACRNHDGWDLRPVDIGGAATQLSATFAYTFGRGTEMSFVDSTTHRPVGPATPQGAQSTQVTHFCADCREALCSACAVSAAHAGHTITPITAAADAVRRDETVLRDTLARRAGDLRAFIADLEQKRGAVDQTVESAHSEVKEVFAELHRRLEAAERAAHGAVAGWHASASQAVNEAKEQLTGQLNETFSAVDELNAELQLGIPPHPALTDNAAGNVVDFWLREGADLAELAQRDTAVGALHLQFSTNELRDAAMSVAETIDELTV